MGISEAVGLYAAGAIGLYLLGSPEHTVSNCTNASYDFAGYMDEGEVHSFKGLKHNKYIHAYWINWTPGHDVYVLDDTVVDWTYRQFDPSVPCPLIEPLKEYRKRFEKATGAKEVGYRVDMGYFTNTTNYIRTEVENMRHKRRYKKIIAEQESRWVARINSNAA